MSHEAKHEIPPHRHHHHHMQHGQEPIKHTIHYLHQPRRVDKPRYVKIRRIYRICYSIPLGKAAILMNSIREGAFDGVGHELQAPSQTELNKLNSKWGLTSQVG